MPTISGNTLRFIPLVTVLNKLLDKKKNAAIEHFYFSFDFSTKRALDQTAVMFTEPVNITEPIKITPSVIHKDKLDHMSIFKRFCNFAEDNGIVLVTPKEYKLDEIFKSPIKKKIKFIY